MTAMRRDAPTGAVIRQTVLLTGLMVVGPLVFYPKSVGLPSFELNPAFGLLEWLLYFGVFAVTGLNLPFSTRIVAAGFTVVYRLLCGAILGTIIAWLRGQSWGTTMAEIMWSYPLSVVPHVLLAALVTRPLWSRLLGETPARRSRRRVVAPPQTVRAIERPRSGVHRVATGSRLAAALHGPATHHLLEPSLDDAVAYMGGYDGVRMCWVVDSDGLPLAVWQRQRYTGDADFWAPVSVEMVDFHRRRFSVTAPCEPDRLEVRTDQGRVIVEGLRGYWLGVLTDPDVDELVSVRLSQARDMVAKRLFESANRALPAGEVHHV